MNGVVGEVPRLLGECVTLPSGLARHLCRYGSSARRVRASSGIMMPGRVDVVRSNTPNVLSQSRIRVTGRAWIDTDAVEHFTPPRERGRQPTSMRNGRHSLRKIG